MTFAGVNFEIASAQANLQCANMNAPSGIQV